MMTPQFMAVRIGGGIRFPPSHGAARVLARSLRFSSHPIALAFRRCRSGMPNVRAEDAEPEERPAKMPRLEATIGVASLRVKKLSPAAVLPSRASLLSAGYDLSSAYDATVPARGKALLKTDLCIAVPEGTYGRIAPRSGLALKHSIDVGAGVVDADYRGPLGVILFNHSDEEFAVKAGDRIAQLILQRIETPSVLEVDELEVTARGEGGFGSTGISIKATLTL